MTIDNLTQQRAIERFRGESIIILAYCDQQGISSTDTSALVEYHRLKIGYDLGLQPETPEESLEKLANDSEKKENFIQIGARSPVPHLYLATITMAENPAYAARIKNLYENKIVGMISNFSQAMSGKF